MGRSRVYVKAPRTGHEVAGVSQHPRHGYYIRNPNSTTDAPREWFGRSLEGLDRAIRRHAEITAPLRISRPMTDDELNR